MTTLLLKEGFTETQFISLWDAWIVTSCGKYSKHMLKTSNEYLEWQDCKVQL